MPLRKSDFLGLEGEWQLVTTMERVLCILSYRPRVAEKLCDGESGTCLGVREVRYQHMRISHPLPRF